ncbi:MAG: NAD(P)H-dependent oxidoreductase [Methanomicrobiales archaeon]|nr:NAD(P)H-dependent oxidoreductase [Methanomicrobiales archaeon]
MCGPTFHDIVQHRYAVKKFDGRKIPEEQMQELYDIIRYAPSGLNFQPWKIKVVTDPEVKQRLLDASWNQSQITTCSHLLVFCANENLKGQIEKIAVEMRHAGIGEETVAKYEKLAKDFVVHVAQEQLKVWTQHNVFLALATALYGAASLGIDACPMGGFDPERFARILDLPPSLLPTMLCALGYAADEPPPKVRLPLSEIFI